MALKEDPDLIALLHDAARRYCVDGIAQSTRAYSQLPGAPVERVARPDGSWTYTDEAYRTFPRYVVLEAILAEVESFVPTDFATLNEARSTLALAGQAGVTSSPDRKPHPIEAAAMDEERRAFERFVQQSDATAWAEAERLPFRRVLGEAEKRALARSFEARWGSWYGGVVDRSDVPPCLTLHTDVADERPDFNAVLHALLARSGVVRIFELREFGPSFELDRIAAGFTYNGAEGFWFTSALDWMIYASHESSITVGGAALVDALREALPEVNVFVYTGWERAP